jgi:uncharacterized surface protein with fasciclin (FAS1) repeats
MKRYAIAGLAAGAAMMIGGALAAVSDNAPSATPIAPGAEVMSPMIGGQAMLPSRDLLDNLAASPDHSVLVAAMKESGVAGALAAKGPFTLFAPGKAAIPAQVLNQDKTHLAYLMRYLVVPGKYDSQALLKAISEGGGQARLRTMEGGVLVARMNGPTNIVMVDENGNAADISTYDIYGKNGVLHVVDRMLQPGGAPRQLAANE